MQLISTQSQVLRSACKWVSIATVAICGAAAAAPPPPAPGMLFSHPQTLSIENEETLTFEAGELFVAENRAKRNGRVISIPYYRLATTAREPAAPIFMLAGGPGVSAIDELAEDREVRAMVQFFRGVADVVLFDQRGAGHARPRLDCPQRINRPADRALTRAAYSAELRKRAAECRDYWREQQIDLAAYNTVENAADTDALRQALGFERISLIANSYGTHLSLALIRLFPHSIERAILFGIEGPDHTYDVPSEVLESLQQIAAAAERSPALQQIIPPGGLIAALETVESRLAESPVVATIVRDGQTQSITLSQFDIQRIARLGAHDRTNLSWPANVIEMYGGDFSRAAEVVLEDRSWPIDSAMYFMMDCASGISAARRQRIVTDTVEQRAMRILGDINLTYFSACDIWDSPDLGETFRSDVISDIPVLFLQGTWDVSTPYVNAVEVTHGFRNGQLVKVERGSHFTLHDLFRSWPDIRPLARSFLRGQAIDPPERIDLPEPSYRLPKVRPASARP